MVEIKEEFRTRLERALEYNDMKPVDLAKLTGIAEATISQYRSGYSKPKDKRLVKIANVLHVDPAWLMGLDVPMGKLSDAETAAFEAGTILGKAARDPDQIHLLQTYQELDTDNQGKVIQFADALALLPKPGATP